MNSNNQAVILIVDDHEQNLKLIGNTIKHLDCRMLFATSGQEALNVVNTQKPDLILLDIMMPNLDGFDVCKILKSDEQLQDIPIIFVTAKVEAHDISKAFSYGAADYVTKPFIQQELIARINVQLKLTKNQAELKEAVSLLSEKNAELEKANEQKDEYLAMVAHDLKNPLAANLSLCELLLEMSDDQFESKVREYLDVLRKSSSNMLHEVNKTLTKENFCKDNVDELERFTVVDTLNEVLNINRINAKRKKIAINFELKNFTDLDDDKIKFANIMSKSSSFREVSDNLISNAVKYSPEGSEVDVRLEYLDSSENSFRLVVSDLGPGFSEQDRTKMFQRFSKLSAVPTAGESSSGLGLYIAKTLASSMNAELSLDSHYESGARFTLEFSDLEHRASKAS